MAPFRFTARITSFSNLLSWFLMWNLSCFFWIKIQYRPWNKSTFINVIIKITWFWSSPSTRCSDTSPFNPKMSNRIVGEKFWLTSLDKMIVQENHAKIEVVKPILCNQSIWFTSRWSSTQSLPSEGKARHKFGGRRQAAAQQLRGGGIFGHWFKKYSSIYHDWCRQF